MDTAAANVQSDHLLQANWNHALDRRANGAPHLHAEFIAEQGRRVHIIDIRHRHELLGPLGHIPNTTWIPLHAVARIADILPRTEPVVLVSRMGTNAATAARYLEALGMQLVAAMTDGIIGWRALGFATSRDPAVFERQLNVASRVPTVMRQSDAPLTIEQIREHIGDPGTVRWVKLAAFLLHGKRSCVDGRDDHGVIGTPGGDAGEFLLGLGAVEKLTGQPIEPAVIAQLLTAHVETFGRFYMHTDVHALKRLFPSMRDDPRLSEIVRPVRSVQAYQEFLAAPPPLHRAAILEHLQQADHVGCGHLKLMLNNSDTYQIRAELVRGFLRAFFVAHWEDAPEYELVTLGGDHGEGAVVNVILDQAIEPFTRVPLVSPACNGNQMFVNDPQVADYMRRQLALFLIQQGHLLPLQGIDVGDLTAAICELGQVQLNATLQALAKGLPIYTVRFARDGTFNVS